MERTEQALAPSLGMSGAHCHDLLSVVQYSSMKFSVVQCGSVWFSVVQCGSVWFSVVQCGSVWFSGSV